MEKYLLAWKYAVKWIEGDTGQCMAEHNMQASTEDEFERKELESWDNNIKAENAMQGNGTTLFEMGAV